MSWIEYYGLAIISLILVCFLMLLLKKTRLMGLSVTLCFVILFFGIKGIQNYYGIKFIYNESKRQAFLNAIQNNEEIVLHMSPASWLQDVDGRGSDAIISLEFRDKIGVVFPLGSAPGIRTLYCAEDDGFISYVTDRFGFRNQDSEWNTSTHDILILGDSFAESACVPDPLQSNFDKDLNLVSLGIGGNGPLTSVATFMEYNNRFKANTVYFIVVSNDYSRVVGNNKKIDLEREIREPILRRYISEPGFTQGYFNGLALDPYRKFSIQYSRTLSDTLPGIEDSINIRTVANFFFYEFVKNILKAYIKREQPERRFINKSELEKVYRRAIDTANLSASRLVYVIIPDKGSSCRGDTSHRFITNVLEGLDANVLDLWHMLCDLKYFAYAGNHFNSRGYEALSNFLESDFREHAKSNGS